MDRVNPNGRRIIESQLASKNEETDVTLCSPLFKSRLKKCQKQFTFQKEDAPLVQDDKKLTQKLFIFQKGGYDSFSFQSSHDLYCMDTKVLFEIHRFQRF